MGHHPPPDTPPCDIKDAIHHLAHLHLACSPACFCRWDKRRDHGPFFVAYIARIGSSCCHLSLPLTLPSFSPRILLGFIPLFKHPLPGLPRPLPHWPAPKPARRGARGEGYSSVGASSAYTFSNRLSTA